MEGRDGEDAQSSHGQLGRTRSKTQQAFRVGGFAALQTGQVATTAETIPVKPLPILPPQENLTEGGVKKKKKKKKDGFYDYATWSQIYLWNGSRFGH